MKETTSSCQGFMLSSCYVGRPGSIFPDGNPIFFSDSTFLRLSFKQYESATGARIMTILLRCRHRLWYLLLAFHVFQGFLFGPFVEAQVLVTLVEDICLQPCFIVSCVNLDPQCVCGQLQVIGSETFLVDEQCAQEKCATDKPQKAFSKLTSECSSLYSTMENSQVGIQEQGTTQAVMNPPMQPTASADPGKIQIPTLTTVATRKTDAPTSPLPNPGVSTPVGRIIVDSTNIPPTTTAPPLSVLTSSVVSPSDLPYSTSSVPSSESSASTGVASKANTQTDVKNSGTDGLLAAKIILPITGVSILAGLAFFLYRGRQRKSKRNTIGSFAAVKGLNNSTLSFGAPLDPSEERGIGIAVSGEGPPGVQLGFPNNGSSGNLTVNGLAVLNRLPSAGTDNASDPYIQRDIPIK
ncbi:hypothetical protein RUND412_007145 [Rhizina undulata]